MTENRKSEINKIINSYEQLHKNSPHLSKPTWRSQRLTTAQSVCIALHFFASGTFLYSVGDAEHLAKATVCREIRRVYLALRQYLNIYITFPGHLPTQRIKENFYAIAGFPSVLGAVDGTHIRIQAPAGPTEADYVNRKSFHSLNVQMICDSNCLITNVEAKWPGSVHDSKIFRASSLAQRFGEGKSTVFQARVFTSQAFYMETSDHQAERFQCLKGLGVRPDRACNIVGACAVLHNIATIRREKLPTVLVEEQWEDIPALEERLEGRTVRDLYRDSYFM